MFFHDIGLNLSQILPQRPHPLYFFQLISNSICWGAQLVLMTCVAIQQFWKKVDRASWKLFCPVCTEKGVVIMDHTHNGKFCFGRNNKSRSSAFRSFWLSYESFSYVEGCFLSKKVSFPAKTTVGGVTKLPFNGLQCSKRLKLWYLGWVLENWPPKLH